VLKGWAVKNHWRARMAALLIGTSFGMFVTGIAEALTR
jgi:hypothetical protein